jgi:hypothetical protein
MSRSDDGAIALKLMYEEAIKQHGWHMSAQALVCMLLDEEISKQLNFQASAERKASAAEMIQAGIVDREGDTE